MAVPVPKREYGYKGTKCAFYPDIEIHDPKYGTIVVGCKSIFAPNGAKLWVVDKKKVNTCEYCSNPMGSKR